MEEEYNEDGVGFIGIFIKIIIFGLFIWFIKREYDDYKYGEKKPFWKGTELIQVCKTPYYSSDECYKLNVKLIDNKNAQIFFNNGGYILTSDITCYFAAEYMNRPKYIFCRSWDKDGQQWDFAPVWAYYPSTEDLLKSLEKYNLK